jgi:hypothetical protein
MKRMMYVCAILTVGFINMSLAQDINGKWKGQMQGPEGAMDIVYTFKVGADTLAGTVESPMGELQIANGKVAGSKFSFDISFNDMTFTQHCTVLSDSISLKFPGMQGDTMEIFLKRMAKAKE